LTPPLGGAAPVRSGADESRRPSALPTGLIFSHRTDETDALYGYSARWSLSASSTWASSAA